MCYGFKGSFQYQDWLKINNMIKYITLRNINMKLLAYNRSLELCAKMNYETENLDFIDHIKPTEIFFDLGACEGRFSIYAALKGIKCYAFEPDKYNFEILKKNIELNNLSHLIEPFNIALGECNKDGLLKVGQPWAGGHNKVVENEYNRQDLEFTYNEVQKVNIFSLDSFIKSANIPFPNYLKIDVDGSENAVMLGASKTLRNTELNSIIFELNIIDKYFISIIENLKIYDFVEIKRYLVPNEKHLYNVLFNKFRNQSSALDN